VAMSELGIYLSGVGAKVAYQIRVLKTL